ncbi:HNH endonuclease signature motif containing protein [Dietzia sp. PP-33]|jgi:hypothetical protein|uniref:HNH endonuclease signature motif containing protein n=1 Tax=Dietzia sp. PP-33 TaxID=2957500 RepID=UPI0029A65C46|nr:DUF222 domain-containing protein [Dietzia sp. PP-33]MDX2357328.1 HNH endonuclease [Dietzia sp. PP-33]
MQETIGDGGEGMNDAADSAPGVGGHPSALRELTDAARDTWVAENRAAGARLAACYELFRECVRQDEAGAGDGSPPGHAVVDPFDVCAGYVVAAMPISVGRAATMISLAADLTERYPAVMAALVAGRMEQRAAELLARQMATVDPAVLSQVQQEVVDDYLAALAAGERLGARTVRESVDAIIARYDSDGIRQRKDAAARDRGVHIRKGAEGMTNLWATLASDEAAVLAEAINQRAAEFADPEPAAAPATSGATSPGAGSPAAGRRDPDAEAADMSSYPLPERRADALLSLVCGDLGRARATGLTPDEPPAPLRPRVTVFARGRGLEPQVEFPRTGESALQALLDMLATSDGASLEHVDPALGAADDARRSLTYRPSAELARRIRLRDGTCRHPGCTVSAEYCDIDHCRPFDHSDPQRGGHTTECNLMCLCRRHHRFKTFSGWIYDLAPDGTLVVVTPDGSTLLTRPSGALAAYRREQARTEHRAWQAQQARSPEPGTADGEVPSEPTYWTRRAARHRTERANKNRATTERARTRPPASRWWNRNKPVISRAEQQVHQLLEEILDPPPF